MTNIIQLLDVCENPGTLKVIMFITEIMNYVFFMVPIGLILFISFDLFKNVIAQKEDDMKKNLQIAIKRIIYCIILFLVPTIVSATMNILSDLKVPYTNCIDNANKTAIEELEIKQANTLVAKAEKDQTSKNITEAQTAIDQITNKSEKEKLQTRIDTVNNIIKEKAIEERDKKEEELKKKKEVTSNYVGGTTQSGNGGLNGALKGTPGQGLWVAHQKNDADRVKKAIEEGFWGIEVDVHGKTENNKTVFPLYHDEYHGYNLDEFLDTCKSNNIVAVLDLKTGINYNELVKLVSSKDMLSKTIFMREDVSTLKKIYEINNNARNWLLIMDNDDLELARKRKSEYKQYFEGVDIYAKVVTEDVIKEMHNEGLTVCGYSYTTRMYEGREASTLKSWGIDYLSANNIDE